MAQPVHSFDHLPPIDSVEELFAVARAMEVEAAERYAGLSRRMAAAGHAELAELFAELERQERDHEAGITELARRRGIDPDVAAGFRWQHPETVTERQIAEAGGELLMTPESALNLAIHNEQRAFAFFVHVATETDDERVREFAERMAGEEIGHVALLRLERRRAARRRLAAEGPARPAAFEAVAPMDRYVADQTRQGNRELGAAAAGARAAGRPQIARRLERLAAGQGAAQQAVAPEAVFDVVADELRRTERLYEVLLQTVEQGRDEALVAAAQAHARTMLQRLAQLADLHSALRQELPTS